MPHLAFRFQNRDSCDADRHHVARNGYRLSRTSSARIRACLSDVRERSDSSMVGHDRTMGHASKFAKKPNSGWTRRQILYACPKVGSIPRIFALLNKNLNQNSNSFARNRNFGSTFALGDDGRRMLAGKIPIVVLATPRLQTQGNVITPASTV